MLREFYLSAFNVCVLFAVAAILLVAWPVLDMTDWPTLEMERP